MASNSSRSISTAPAGSVTPSRRNLSAPQSNSTNSIDRLVAALTARKTLTASGVTSFPTPSPGMIAIRAAGPPLRKGIPGKDSPPQLQVLNQSDESRELKRLGAILPSKRGSRHYYQIPLESNALLLKFGEFGA